MCVCVSVGCVCRGVCVCLCVWWLFPFCAGTLPSFWSMPEWVHGEEGCRMVWAFLPLQL